MPFSSLLRFSKQKGLQIERKRQHEIKEQNSFFFSQINKDKLEKKFLTFLSIKEAYEEEECCWKKITRVGREAKN